MAYGEFGGLLPRETSFASPSAYTEAAKAEATKRASYLAQMDQFYAQLEESTRQFDEELSFREEQWGEQLGLEKDRFGFEQEQWEDSFGLQQEQFGFQQTQWNDQFSLMEAQQKLAEKQFSAQSRAQSEKLSLEEQRLEAQQAAQQRQSQREDELMGIFLPYMESGAQTNQKLLEQKLRSGELGIDALQNELRRSSLGVVGASTGQGAVNTEGWTRLGLGREFARETPSSIPLVPLASRGSHEDEWII